MDLEEENPKEEFFSLMGDEDASLQQNIAEAAGVKRSLEDVRPDAVKTERAQQKEELQQAERKYLYLVAEFENYKKRVQREQIEQTKFANERLLKELLVVLDDLERAIAHSKETSDSKKIAEGVELILKQFLSCLGRYGVVPMDTVGKPFDPAYHQAVGYLERSDSEPNQVIEEVQRGYMLYDRVLRAPMVLISQIPTPKGSIVGGGPSLLGESIDRKV